jgi:enamine deaminase RidA (YjgF/YER057c/UK114 family)
MKTIQPEGWPRPAGYANGVETACGRMVFVSGQVGWNPLTGKFEARNFVEQVQQTLANVVGVLRAADVKPADVTRLTWYITDKDAYVAGRKQIGEAYRAHFGSHYPAMSVVVVKALVEDEALVEIEATALTQN